MNILFVTFKKLSYCDGGLRSISILSALADAGHRVDLISAQVQWKTPDNVNVLCGALDQEVSRRKLRSTVSRALKNQSYDVVHAVDDAFMFVHRSYRLKRLCLVYEASRCFSVTKMGDPIWYWRFVSKYHRDIERKMLAAASLVLSPCDTLTSDLKKFSSTSPIVQIEHSPGQSFFPSVLAEKSDLIQEFDGDVSAVVLCRVLDDNRGRLKKLLLAVRKVLGKSPKTAFYFVGNKLSVAEEMASNLDIRDRCSFLSPRDEEKYFSVLSISDVALFVPLPEERYPHSEAISLLNSNALVVASDENAYGAIFSDETAVLVDSSVISIADGILSIFREPLLAYARVNNAHQLIVDCFSLSTFKYKVRKAYRMLME